MEHLLSSADPRSVVLIVSSGLLSVCLRMVFNMCHQKHSAEQTTVDGHTRLSTSSSIFIYHIDIHNRAITSHPTCITSSFHRKHTSKGLRETFSRLGSTYKYSWRPQIIMNETTVTSLNDGTNDDTKAQAGNDSRSSPTKMQSGSSPVKSEARLFLELAIPMVLLSVGFTVSPLLTASYVGRKFGATHLSGFTLANLTGNLCSLSILAGLFSASDTLSPQAYGAMNYPELQHVAVRGLSSSLTLLLMINVIVIPFIRPALIACGQDPAASAYASQWYRIYVVGLPFYATYMVFSKFLASQNKTRPLLIVLGISCVIVLPVALEVCTTIIGFLGSAVAYSVYQTSQAVLLVLYIWRFQPHRAETWPGLRSLKNAFRFKPFKAFLSLGLGGMFAQSEWVYWEAQGLMIGSLDVVSLAAHTIPNNLIMVTFMIPFGAGTALSIRMGTTLATNVPRTKKLVISTVSACMVVLAFVSVLMYAFRESIFAIFTTDEQVLARADMIWWKVCLFNFSAGLFAVLCGVAAGLGMQWTLALVNIGCLFGVGLPSTYYFSLVKHGGLGAAWTWINVPYILMNGILITSFAATDWYKISDEINARETQAAEAELLQRSPKRTSTSSSSMLTSEQDRNVYGSIDEHTHLL